MDFLVTENLNWKVMNKFIVKADSAEDALEKVQKLNMEELAEGEPFLHPDSELFVEPIEFLNDVCFI
jgi:hypothetical protein